ncbi:MAG: hypothetical protein IPK97_03145 [Ahniella sp.]|nr:hypothetical protein [Ahniella sp.]
MSSELIIIIVLTLAILALVWRGLRAVRREMILKQLLDDADLLEARLLDTRTRMRDLDALLGRLPPDITESARASLNSEAGVQHALKLILQHRLWIRDNVKTATAKQLNEVRENIRRSLAKLDDQLKKLDSASDDLKTAYAKSDAVMGRASQPDSVDSDS